MKNYYISWWNLENLFNVEDSEQRPDYLQGRLRSELKGWNEEVLDKKLNQLASIIKKINGNTGPDILGVCKLEKFPEMVSGGRYPDPIRFGRPSSSTYNPIQATATTTLYR